MKRLILLFSLVTLFFGLAFVYQSKAVVLAETESEKLERLNKQIEEYQKQVVALQNQANTLANQVAQFDAQISLTEVRINKTEEEIGDLGGRIDELEVSLDSLSTAFSGRAMETYKMARVGEAIWMLLSSSDLSQAVARYHYLRKIQESDRELMIKLQRTQNVYRDQKTRLETLIEQLQEQKDELDSQKKAKANLLQVTKNDEKKYQQLLAASKAEYEAIQAIIAGRGDETEIGNVSEGQKIASIIQGASCNSNGTHLHFIVAENGQAKDPFNYLKPGIDYEDNSDGDQFNPKGSWIWPINPKVRYNQGYGNTAAIRSKQVWYNFHNGIDISSTSSLEVKAVKAGKLFQGSYGGNGGCRLRYVRVDHSDSDLDTFYLHINY